MPDVHLPGHRYFKGQNFFVKNLSKKENGFMSYVARIQPDQSVLLAN